MSIQKWEFRHPLLVLTLVTLSVYVPVAKSDVAVSCTSLDTIEASCASLGGYEIKSSGDSCIEAKCFGNDSLNEFEELKRSLNPQTPELSLNEHPALADETYDVTCMGFSTLISFSDLVLTADPPAPPLKQHIVVLKTAGDGTRLRILSAPITLTKSRHGQMLGCQMVYFENASITEDVRNVTAKYELYYFVTSKPRITGPSDVELLEEATWECISDKVTFGDEENFKVDFGTNPVVTVPKETHQTATILNPGETPVIRMVTTSLHFKVPVQLKPRFFLKCSTRNAVVSPSVSDYANQLAIAVVVRPRSFTAIFNTIGICSGLGALAVGVGLLVFYIRKRGLTPAPKDAKKDEPPADKPPEEQQSMDQKNMPDEEPPPVPEEPPSDQKRGSHAEDENPAETKTSDTDTGAVAEEESATE